MSWDRRDYGRKKTDRVIEKGPEMTPRRALACDHAVSQDEADQLQSPLEVDQLRQEGIIDDATWSGMCRIMMRGIEVV